MDKATVGAEGQNLHIHFPEHIVFGGNCRQFGGSDKGEIPGIKTEHNPFAFIVGQAYVFETP